MNLFIVTERVYGNKIYFNRINDLNKESQTPTNKRIR